jgi:hypothetical protein
MFKVLLTSCLRPFNVIFLYLLSTDRRFGFIKEKLKSCKAKRITIERTHSVYVKWRSIASPNPIIGMMKQIKFNSQLVWVWEPVRIRILTFS